MHHAKVQALPLIRAATSTSDVCEAQAKLNALASNLLREQRDEFRTWCETKATDIAGHLIEDAAHAAELAIIDEFGCPGDEDWDETPSLAYVPEYWRHQEPERDLQGFNDDEA